MCVKRSCYLDRERERDIRVTKGEVGKRGRDSCFSDFDDGTSSLVLPIMLMRMNCLCELRRRQFHCDSGEDSILSPSSSSF